MDKVVEANLKVVSSGGDVQLGTIRAFTAEVDTLAPHHCGSLQVCQGLGKSRNKRDSM